jgi:hypothetical protein
MKKNLPKQDGVPHPDGQNFRIILETIMQNIKLIHEECPQQQFFFYREAA